MPLVIAHAGPLETGSIEADNLLAAWGVIYYMTIQFEENSLGGKVPCSDLIQDGGDLKKLVCSAFNIKFMFGERAPKECRMNRICGR